MLNTYEPRCVGLMFFFFFFNDTATTEIYTLSLHDALPISSVVSAPTIWPWTVSLSTEPSRSEEHTSELQSPCNLVCRLLLEKKKQIHDVKRGKHRESPGKHRRDDGKILGHIVGDGERSQRSVFFFNDTATTEIYTLSLHDALPI